MQTEKGNARAKSDELKAKIEKLEKNISYIENEKSDLQAELERIKTVQVKVEY